MVAAKKPPKKPNFKEKVVAKAKAVKEDVEDDVDSAKATMKKVGALYKKGENWAKRRKKA